MSALSPTEEIIGEIAAGSNQIRQVIIAGELLKEARG